MARPHTARVRRVGDSGSRDGSRPDIVVDHASGHGSPSPCACQPRLTLGRPPRYLRLAMSSSRSRRLNQSAGSGVATWHVDPGAPLDPGMVVYGLMFWIRPRLARVAAGWLVFQLTLLLSVPTTLCSTMSASTVGAECTCDHADGTMCPMHHTRGRAYGESGSHSCSCRSTSDPMAALAAALTGPPAVLVAEANSAASFDSAEYVEIAASAPPPWIAIPDSPPPRA